MEFQNFWKKHANRIHATPNVNFRHVFPLRDTLQKFLSNSITNQSHMICSSAQLRTAPHGSVLLRTDPHHSKSALDPSIITQISFAFSPMGTDFATKGGGNNRKPLQTAKKPTPWKVSEGKKYLERELKDDGSHLHQKSIKDIHSSDNHFSVYPLKNFTTNFRNLKKRIEATRARVELDNKNVLEHKKMCLREPKTKRGYLHWNGHPAKAKLVKDVRNGTAEKMLPSKLQETRKSYK